MGYLVGYCGDFNIYWVRWVLKGDMIDTMGGWGCKHGDPAYASSCKIQARDLDDSSKRDSIGAWEVLALWFYWIVSSFILAAPGLSWPALDPLSTGNLWSSLQHAASFNCSIWDLVPWPGIKPWPPALGAQSLSHWATREVPNFGLILTLVLVNSLPVEPQGKPKNTGVGSLSLLQQIFSTQESNQGLLHYRWISFTNWAKREPCTDKIYSKDWR